jgi:hypothetical protein
MERESAGRPDAVGRCPAAPVAPVTCAAVLMTSATENSQQLPRLKELVGLPAASHSMPRHGRSRTRACFDLSESAGFPRAYR